MAQNSLEFRTHGVCAFAVLAMVSGSGTEGQDVRPGARDLNSEMYMSAVSRRTTS